MTRWGVAELVFLAATSLTEAVAAGGPQWSGHGPDGGFIASLATAPTNPLIVFAGTSAGVYKSVDGGHSWVGPGSGLPLTTVSGLAVDPSNAERVFAAVGDSTGDSSLGGVYRSTDGGATWSVVVTLSEIDGYGYGGVPTTVTIDYRDGRKVYAGNYGGLFLRSDDGGDAWTAVHMGGVDVSMIEVSRTSGSIYACANFAYRSDDGGKTWTELPLGVSCYSLTVLPTTPETILIGNAHGSGIQKSTDGGRTWRSSNQGLPSGRIGLCSRCYVPITVLKADPAGPAHVFAGLYGGGVHTSSDAGDSWTPGPSGVPPDARVLSFAFLPQSTLVGTGDAGVYAINGRTASPSNEGLKASIVYGLAVTRSSHLFAASGGGISRSSDGGNSWTAAESPGPGTVTLGIWAHPINERLLFAASGYGGLLRSEDAGLSWDIVVADGQFSQVTHVAFKLNRPRQIFAGTAPLPGGRTTILESNDSGATWVAVEISSSVMSVLWVGFDSFDDSMLFARADAEGLLRSIDHGATWHSLPFESWDEGCRGFNAVVLNPWGEHAIYAAGSHGRVICRSDDSGLTFHETLRDYGVPPITALLTDPLRPGTFYASPIFQRYNGIKDPVLVSSDRGVTWSAMASGFPGTEVFSLALDASSSKLFAGTVGSGVISISLPAGRLKVAPEPGLEPPIRKYP